jgi:tetratricopeptide (TPR) repeat protein
MGIAASFLIPNGYEDQAKSIARRGIDICYKNNFHNGKDKEKECLAWMSYLAGDYSKARNYYRQLLQEYPNNAVFLGYLGAIAARLGQRKEASRISRVLEPMDSRSSEFGWGWPTYCQGRLMPGNSWQIFCQGRIAALLGDRTRATQLLIRAHRGGAHIHWYYHHALDLLSLQDYPEYKEFIKPIK